MTEPFFLPRFSDARDIDDFVRGLEQFERGELSPEKFRLLRLARGVYGQRQEGFQMLRVKIPQGVVGPEQLEALAAVGESYGRGLGHVTTRQNVQFHFVPMAHAEAALRDLEAVGLTTREACGNTVRNICCDALTGLTERSLFDVRPYGEALTRHFLRKEYCQALPRKFKVALSSDPEDAALCAINCLGFLARFEGGRRGFKVVAAGGLSTRPQNALTLHEFLPAEELLDCAEAVVRLFDRTGNRENKDRARLKYVLKKVGPERFVELYREERAAVAARGGTPLTDLPDAQEPPPPPLPADAQEPTLTALDAARYFRFRTSNVRAQSQPGYVAVTLRLRLGDITSAQMRAVAQVLRAFGNYTARFTLEQNLLVPWVPQARLAELFQLLQEHGLDAPEAGTVADVTSCPGADSCQLAVTASRQLGRLLGDYLEGLTGDAAVARDEAAATTIKISGCPNSCGQHHVADLGFHGAVRRVGEKTAPVYQLHLGGGMDGSQGARFGRQVLKLPARRVPEAVERLLLLFAKERASGEAPRDFFLRLEDERVEALLGDLAAVDENTAEEHFSDLGQEKSFEVRIGTGECAA